MDVIIVYDIHMKKAFWITGGVVGFFLLMLLALGVGWFIQRPAVTSSSDEDLVLGSFGTADLAVEESARTSVPSPSPIDTAGETAAEVDQKIIKTGYLELVVEAVPDTISSVTNLATGKGGFVQHSSVSERPDGTRSGIITIRVPASEFETTMDAVKDLATLVENETASGQDVTEEFTDLEAQLRNAQAQEQAYLRILDQATSVKDILAVQEELGSIRTRIERLEGRIQYLENLTSFSTITVQLSEEVSITLPTEEFRPLAAVREAAQALVAFGQRIIIGLIWIVIVGGGILIPVGLIVWLVIWIARNVRKGKKK